MSNRNGFSLVEIIVVLAILAMIVPIFLLVAAHTVNLNNEARLRSGATLLAEGLAEELLAEAGSLPPTGEQAPYTWTWQLATEAGIPTGLQEITVRVTWQYRGKTREVQLVTYRQVSP